EVTVSKARNSIIKLEWSTSLEQNCFEFFSPSNIRKSLNLYWTIWHPNVNIIHRPTFNSCKVKPELLAAMVIIGACVSPDETDKKRATEWFNCVEEVVFMDDDLCAEPLYVLENSVPVPSLQERKVQALQAAYVVCLYQNWEGGDSGKRRIRRFRFGFMVAIIRDIGLSSVVHSRCSTFNDSHFDWRTFALREQLIRVVTWIFLLDHAFSIFNNLPPRMVIKEMKAQVAWPEACFQAPTAQSCQAEIQKWLHTCPDSALLTISDAIIMILKVEMTDVTVFNLASLGPLNLFAFISAFHTLIFQYQNAIIGNGQLAAISQGLSNWRGIWEVYSARFSSTPPHVMVDAENVTAETAWQRTGFMRFSPEYWLLARLMVDRLQHNEMMQVENSLLPSATSSTTSGGPAIVNPDLAEYDQTSMQQVNELISELKKINIHQHDA
ncbi:hypothetical protein Golomagni_06270, partial [Golovinomyces magnicellulatus]